MTPYEKFVESYDGENLFTKHLLISIKNKENKDKREKKIKLIKNIITFFFILFVTHKYYVLFYQLN